MGCKPSKASQVATGNTVSTHNLEKKQSNDLEIKQPNVSEETKIEEIADPVPDTGKGTDNIDENAEEKDVEVNATKGEGKHIPEDSPDQYLSSKKDEEVVEGVVKSVEFLSETAEGPTIEEVDTEAEAGEMMEVETDVSVGEEEKAEEEKEEPSSVNDSVDLKETILVEELNESKAITTPEKQNEGERAE